MLLVKEYGQLEALAFNHPATTCPDFPGVYSFWGRYRQADRTTRTLADGHYAGMTMDSFAARISSHEEILIDPAKAKGQHNGIYRRQVLTWHFAVVTVIPRSSRRIKPSSATGDKSGLWQSSTLLPPF